MKKLLVAINLLLVFAILGVVFYWNPEPPAAPMPGTYAARLGADVPATRPSGSVGFAASGTAGQIAVADPHVRLMPPGIRTSAAYMTLGNDGDSDVLVIAAACPSAGAAELHNHIDDHGVLRMRRVKEIVVPARGMVALRPGGYHVMLIDLKTTLKAGDQLAITLLFADGSSKTVEAPVR